MRAIVMHLAANAAVPSLLTAYDSATPLPALTPSPPEARPQMTQPPATKALPTRAPPNRLDGHRDLPAACWWNRACSADPALVYFTGFCPVLARG
jgi:hypothetical protein